MTRTLGDSEKKESLKTITNSIRMLLNNELSSCDIWVAVSESKKMTEER